MENLKLCEIITSGDYGSMTDLTDNQRKFVTLHTEICRKGAYVVSGMVEFAEKLKEMRDGKSYVEAGFGSFGEYCEKAVGIKTAWRTDTSRFTKICRKTFCTRIQNSE